jgi:Ca-activated chloride channel family protein
MRNLIELVATRPALAPQGGTTHIRITVTPSDERSERSDVRPVALILLADRSGSMADAAGTASVAGPEPANQARGIPPQVAGIPHHRQEHRSKMSVLRDAAERLLDSMRDADRFGLVTFSDVAQRDLPLVTLKNGRRTEARAAIRALRPDASTNLQDGLQLAIAQFDAEILRTHVCKILVITDGLANVGVRTPDGLASTVASAAQTGITVSAIGVGLEYNSAVLGAIGRAGNGDYYHIEHAAGIDLLLQRELQASTGVRLRGVELLLSAGLAAIGENLNGYTQMQTADGVRILLGDLARSRSTWLELTSPAPIDDTIVVHVRMRAIALDDVPEQAEARLLLQVTTGVSAIPEDAALVRELADLLRAQGIGEASELFDSGDVVSGQRRARAQQVRMASLSNTYSGVVASPEDGTLHTLASAQMPASPAERRRLKELAAKTYARRRGHDLDQE